MPPFDGLQGPGTRRVEPPARENGRGDELRPEGRPAESAPSAGAAVGPGADRYTIEPYLQQIQQYVAAQLEQMQASVYRLEEWVRVGGEGARVAPADPYRKLIKEVREAVREYVPRGARVAVVSRGDDELLNLYGRDACHFPADARGGYLGYHPGGCVSAIALLEYQRAARGVGYLIVPQTAFWWFESYPRFEQHLRRRYTTLFAGRDVCEVFALERKKESPGARPADIGGLIEECRRRTGREPAILDWWSGLELKSAHPEWIVFSPPSEGAGLPYLSESIDVVVHSASDPERSGEAHRVARSAVVRGRAGNVSGDPVMEVSWKVDPAEQVRRSASIVIPVFNAVNYTQACLRSLVETLPRSFDGEVIVVDDASTDATPEVLERWSLRDSRIKSLRMPGNRGFVECSNRGAVEARHEYLIFLNNDTVPLDGWLEALLSVLGEHEDAGVVGGKILFPDGALQEAGGLIFRDGSAAHYGRGDHKLDAPMYNWLREVDYCSGAFLATRTALFREIGGFDHAFAPGYYEDVDYCFEVRRRGYRVFYQPESVIVHVEGATAGTDLSSGMKRYQVSNRDRFAERRRRELEQQPDRPSRFDLGAWLSLGMREVQR